MSEENLNRVRQLFPAGMDLAAVFANADSLEAARAGYESSFHPDVETLVDPVAAPMVELGPDVDREAATGIDGFITLWRDWLTVWETWVLGPPEFVDADEDRVLVLYEVRAQSKTHQVEMRIDTGTVLTLRDGLITRIELFFERAKALEAAGLSE